MQGVPENKVKSKSCQPIVSNQQLLNKFIQQPQPFQPASRNDCRVPREEDTCDADINHNQPGLNLAKRDRGGRGTNEGATVEAPSIIAESHGRRGDTRFHGRFWGHWWDSLDYREAYTSLDTCSNGDQSTTFCRIKNTNLSKTLSKEIKYNVVETKGYIHIPGASLVLLCSLQ